MDTTQEEAVRESVSEAGAGARNALADVPKPPDEPGLAATRRVAAAEEKSVVVEGRRARELDVAEEDAEDATTWLLASFHEEVEPPEHTLILNVGSISQPRKIRWRIRALPRETIDKIREESLPQSNRAMRRGALGNLLGDQKQQFKANVRLIIAATLDPDVRAVSARTGLASPEEFLLETFRYVSGLVEFIASAVLTLSGYDEDNVTDAVEADAAGN